MTTNNISERVAELSATLAPITDFKDAYGITEEMLEMGEDSNSYNGSFYCHGQWVKPVFDSWFKGSMLQKVEEFQVIRIYAIEVELEGLAYDEIPEDWDDEDAPPYPEMELTGVTEYRQVWIDKDFNHTEIILNKDFAENKYWQDSYFSCIESKQAWVYEPRFREFISDEVKDTGDSCYYHRVTISYLLSPVAEYLEKNEPVFHREYMEHCNVENADKLFSSFRIAHRHHFAFPTDTNLLRLYVDYLSMLHDAENDLSKPRYITNPLYVCPKDIIDAHNKLMEHKSKIADEKAKREAQEREKAFAEQHSWLFGIEFDNDHFHFKSLDSVEAYRVEGKIMHHCIFKCSYYDRHNVLSMHISDFEGNRVATCSIDVVKGEIVELQTICNDIEWRKGNEYKEIWNTLMARMHTFPKRPQKPVVQVAIKVA